MVSELDEKAVLNVMKMNISTPKDKFLNIFHWIGQSFIVYWSFELFTKYQSWALNFTDYRLWAQNLLINKFWA